jgi:hypothetical protein
MARAYRADDRVIKFNTKSIHTYTYTRDTKPTNIHTHTLQNPHIHTPTHYKTHTYTLPHITKPTHTHAHTLQNPHIHTPTHYKTHTYTRPHITKPVKTTTVQDTHQMVQSSILSIRSPECIWHLHPSFLIVGRIYWRDCSCVQ